MKIRVESFKKMKARVRKNGTRLIIFGAGVIGTITTPAILKENEISDLIDFYVDNDADKWNKQILVLNRKITIFSMEKLREIKGSDYCILLAISRFSELLEELDNYDNLKETDCYIVPMLCIENFRNGEQNLVIKQTKKQMIPKVINYMWLGRKQIPKTLQYCIDSWKRYCADYEIKCWNEDNYDIDKIPYMKQAYEKGAYGFVPDYARLDILYNFGGIYLDTDVELTKSLDDLLFQEAFCSVEKWQIINFGGGSGAKKGCKIVGEMVKQRESIEYLYENGKQNRNTCGFYDTRILQAYGYKVNGRMQNIKGMTIYPYELFHPYDYMTGQITKTTNTYGIHHFSGGWLDEKQKKANQITSLNYERIYQRAKYEEEE